ncbi:MAG: hypothetical protein AAGC72_11160 [Planctomycetota bacterium]
MSYTFFPMFAYLALTGKWRMKPLTDRQLVGQWTYIAVPDGMDKEEAERRLYHDQPEPVNSLNQLRQGAFNDTSE